jgi:hypothetical protein
MTIRKNGRVTSSLPNAVNVGLLDIGHRCPHQTAKNLFSSVAGADPPTIAINDAGIDYNFLSRRIVSGSR